jgi:hypothetical protein
LTLIEWLAGVEEVEKIQEMVGGSGGNVVVVGLHCCGGLTDAIVDLACEGGWPFVVCPCCFPKHRHLRKWTAAPSPEEERFFEVILPATTSRLHLENLSFIHTEFPTACFLPKFLSSPPGIEIPPYAYQRDRTNLRLYPKP